MGRHPASDKTAFELRHAAFLAHKEKNRNASYAEYTMARVVEILRGGASHATLGPHLNGAADWWEAGIANYFRLLGLFPLSKDSRVVDYGCGSLRIGGHFIDNLAPGNYFGIDVNRDLIAMGEALVGTEMLAEKRPQFGGIDPETIDRAQRFGADLVFSYAVCQHVHPDEAPAYFGNLARIAAKPGAVLLFTATIADAPLRKCALSWPLQRYGEMLPHLVFRGVHGLTDKTTPAGERYQTGILMFRRE